ncbi:hypothetical protein STRCI_001269 [Streptomyces cinnabarinus]|uniref:Uncharacterized protein n=1 Tax=Streptomyces cinnabarinus TaxID=67287 RepID=A0ABY7K8Q6_9ACTN|nr:hypothetical protein [Streptomyces cinnabarinus]WAZ20170.1 hypothetical protein STRCI_001269 [Streptomyces cinnabarinus]
MPGFGMLTDTFDDGVRDPVLWSGSYGDVEEAGGRARVPCTTAFSAYQSAAVYTLTGSQVACRVYPPAAGGAAGEALAELLVITAVGGTDGGFSLNRVTGLLKLISRTGYADANEVVLTYDPVAHAWLRLREASGLLLWETSPDGGTWTARRTAPAAAWTADTNLSVILAGHRDSGSGDFAEFDNFNLLRRARLTSASPAGAALAPLERSAPAMSGSPA